MEFRILGPLEAVVEGRVVELKAAKPRALLAILLLHANEPVASYRRSRISGPVVRRRPRAVLQAYVSQLRKALGHDVIVTEPAGYELRLERGGLDLDRFERLVAEARAAEPPAAAEIRARLSRSGVARHSPSSVRSWARSEIGRLEELRLESHQERIDADLALGRHAEVVGDSSFLVAEHPLLERLRGQLILALYRSGRQADALDAYRAVRDSWLRSWESNRGRNCGAWSRRSSIRILGSTSLGRGRGQACVRDRRRSSAVRESCARFVRC